MASLHHTTIFSDILKHFLDFLDIIVTVTVSCVVFLHTFYLKLSHSSISFNCDSFLQEQMKDVDVQYYHNKFRDKY